MPKLHVLSLPGVKRGIINMGPFSDPVREERTKQGFFSPVKLSPSVQVVLPPSSSFHTMNSSFQLALAEGAFSSPPSI